MKLLAIDTATDVAGIAIAEGDRILDEVRHGPHANQGRRTTDLLVAIDEACRRAGVTPRALDAIAVGAGPGSFTGLRIGMATAKGIAFAAGRPLWAVSSLAAIAHAAAIELANQQLLAHMDGLVVAVLDARRGEVFAGCYRADAIANADPAALVGEERVLTPAELAAWATEHAAGAPVSYAGDALAVHAALAPLTHAWIACPPTPTGGAVARLALAGPRVDVLAAGVPTYIRASEAEIKYPDGVPGALRER